jgi:hypothetical protein
VEEPRSALDVREGGRIDAAQALELRTRRESVAQLRQQRRRMPLQHAEQVGDVARAIVDRFDRRAQAAAQEHPAHADEGLGIAGVRHRRDARDQALRQVALAAHPRRHAGERINASMRRIRVLRHEHPPWMTLAGVLVRGSQASVGSARRNGDT